MPAISKKRIANRMNGRQAPQCLKTAQIKAFDKNDTHKSQKQNLLLARGQLAEKRKDKDGHNKVLRERCANMVIKKENIMLRKNNDALQAEIVNRNDLPPRPLSAPPPKIATKDVKELSKSQKNKRIKRVREVVTQSLPPAFRVTDSPQKKKPIARESLDLMLNSNMSVSQYQSIRKLSSTPVVSLYAIRKELKSVINEYGAFKKFDVAGKTGYYFSPKQAFLARLKWAGIDDKDVVRITLSGDCGGGFTKLCFFLADVDKPQSPANISFLGYYEGADNYANLSILLQHLNDEIKDIHHNGLEGPSGNIKVLLTFVGDLKIECGLLGLQGSNATMFCSWCDIKRCDVKITGFRGHPRTMELMINNAEKCAAELLTTPMKKQAAVKQKYGNVAGKPLFDVIDPCDFVPPAFHLMADVVNKSVNYIRKTLKNDNINNVITQLKLHIHYPSQDFNGNECRKLLKNLRERKVVLVGAGADLLLAASDVEQFAEARDLCPGEIEQLETFILRLFEVIRKYEKFPLANKLHALECHVVDFVKKFGSWGRFAEQSTESIHNVCNRLHSRVKGSQTEDEEKRNKFVNNAIVGKAFTKSA